jgi:hypothetical protein
MACCSMKNLTAWRNRDVRARVRICLAAVAFLGVLAGCGSGGLSQEEAKSIILQNDSELQKSIFLDMGFLSSNCGTSPNTGKYALLEKAGLITIEPGFSTTEVITTSKGDAMFKAIGAQRMDAAQFKKVTGQVHCNLRTWALPLARKEIMEIQVTPTGEESADVSYNYKWKTNELGQEFLVDSSYYKGLSSRMQESLKDDDLPFDNSFPHATKQKFVHDDRGWHMAK